MITHLLDLVVVLLLSLLKLVYVTIWLFGGGELPISVGFIAITNWHATH